MNNLDQPPQKNYGRLTITLHWIMAVAIIGMYPLGLIIVDLTYYDAGYKILPYIHKSIGLILLGLLLIQFFWHFVSHHPEPIPQPKILHIISQLTHKFLFILIAIVLVSGYLISTADGRGIAIFNWIEIPALPIVMDNQADLAGKIHFYAATTLVVLAGLHALAALKHHFIDKDVILKRMLGINK
ncbi:MAG: cytochrome b, partial [Ostreibacterium sp.]